MCVDGGGFALGMLALAVACYKCLELYLDRTHPKPENPKGNDRG